MTLLKDLISIGLTPLEGLTVVAVVILMLAMRRMDKRNRRDRQIWHQETRRELDAALVRVDESERRHEICDADRQKFKRQIAGLQQQVKILHACPHGECPLKVMMKKIEES